MITAKTVAPLTRLQHRMPSYLVYSSDDTPRFVHLAWSFRSKTLVVWDLNGMADPILLSFGFIGDILGIVGVHGAISSSTCAVVAMYGP